MHLTASAVHDRSDGAPKASASRGVVGWIWPAGWRGRIVRMLLLLGLLAAIAAWVVLRGPVAKALVLPTLAEKLGAEVDARSVSINLDGSIVVRGLVVRAPGIEGEAGEVLRARRCVIRLEALAADAEPESVLLRAAVLRVSQDQRTSVVNLESLGIFGREADAESAPPRILIENSTIELGEHDERGYRHLRDIVVDGSVLPTAEPGTVHVDLRERPGPGVPLAVRGSSGPQGTTVLLEGLELSDWPASAVPSSIRGTFELLDLRGRVGPTRVAIDAKGAVRIRAALEGVGVTLPFDVEGAYAPGGPLARMDDVRGAVEFGPGGVRADLSGMLEDLPYEVLLDYQGLSETSPFHCVLRTRDYQLSRDPRLVPLLPSIVGERLRNFTQPTGVLSAEVVIERRAGAGDAAGVIDASGWIDISGGAASYENFPYEFRNLNGRVYFDTSAVVIDELRGVSASGATLTATGIIAPPSDVAQIDLTIRVRDVPIDERLKAGMRSRASAMDALISMDRLNELESAGLVHDPLERGLGKAFEAGGMTDIDIFVHRPLGEHVSWSYSVGISAARIGLVPQAFGYPLIGSNVLLALHGDRAHLVRGTFEGLSGGKVDLALEADVGPQAEGVRVDVLARDVPADELLLHAVGGSVGERDLAAIGRSAGIAGVVDADLRVREQEGAVRIEGEVRTHGLRMAPASGAMSIDDIDATLVIKDGTARLESVGRLWDQQNSASSGVWAEADVDLDGGCFEGSLHVGGLDVRSPVDDLIEMVAPEAAAEIRAARREYDPAFRTNLAAHFICDEAGDRVQVRASPRSDIAVTIDGERVELRSPRGVVALDPGEQIELHDFGGTLAFGGEDGGGLVVDGVWPLTAQPGTQPMRLRLEGARFESPLARRIVRESLGEAGLKRYQAAEPAGTYDVIATFVPRSDRSTVEASIRPRRLELTNEGERIVFEQMSGGIDVAPTGVVTVDLVAHAPTWEATTRGIVQTQGGEGPRFEGAGTIRSEGLPSDLQALLPDVLTDAAEAISLTVGGLEVRIDEMVLQWGATDSVPISVRTNGSAGFTGAGIDVGLPLREADGRLLFAVDGPAEQPVQAELNVRLEQCLAAGIQASNAEAVVRVDSGTNRVVIDGFDADCHGGRLAGDGVVEPTEEGSRRYSVELAVSGVRLAPVITDLRLRDTPRAERTLDESRGTLGGTVALTGLLDDVASRRGRGNALIGQGAVVDMPLLLPLIQVGNLQAPSTGEVDLAVVSFFVQGNEVTFDQLSAFADTVEVFGFGTMAWPEMDLDLMFLSRSVREVPVVSVVVESLRDELFAARVTGRLGSASVEGSTLRGTRSAVGMLFGDTPTAQEERLAEIERRARDNRDRARRASDRVRRSGGAVPLVGVRGSEEASDNE